MGKVGIITFVHPFNYGAHLQAYAMQRLFGKSGHDTTVLDVGYPKMDIHDKLQQLIPATKYLPAFYYRPIVSKKMRRFDHQYNKIGYRRVSSDTHQLVAHINELGFDALICGSDELWKASTPELAPPSIFYLPAELKAKRFAFAVSANGDHVFTSKELSWLRETFQGYSGFFVRDTKARDLVEQAIGLKPELTSDPTILHDFNEFAGRIMTLPQKGKKQRVCFMLIQNVQWVVDLVRELLGPQQYEYYSVFQTYRHTAFLPASPEEFVNLFAQFDLVVTNMFHGTIFALRNNAPFIAMDTHSRYKDNTSKIQDLLTRLSLQERHFSLFDMDGAKKEAVGILAKKLLAGECDCRYDEKLEGIRAVMRGQLKMINDVIDGAESEAR